MFSSPLIVLYASRAVGNVNECSSGLVRACPPKPHHDEADTCHAGQYTVTFGGDSNQPVFITALILVPPLFAWAFRGLSDRSDQSVK